MTIKELFKKNGILISKTMTVGGLVSAWNKLPSSAKKLIPAVGVAITALSTAKTTLDTAQKTYTTASKTLASTTKAVTAAAATLTGVPIAPAQAAADTDAAAIHATSLALQNANKDLTSQILNSNVPGT